jgi:hypothetical protein
MTATTALGGILASIAIPRSAGNRRHEARPNAGQSSAIRRCMVDWCTLSRFGSCLHAAGAGESKKLSHDSLLAWRSRHAGAIPVRIMNNEGWP